MFRSRFCKSFTFIVNGLPKVAQFSKRSSARCDVSTYESLVNQNKPCSSPDKPNKQPPGKSPECLSGRHGFHNDTENSLNDQIAAEFQACFTYLSMACYYGKTEVSLPGCQGFFMTMHRHEHEHGITLMNYILMRGGTVRVPNISVDSQSWNDVRKALGAALELECYVKEKLTEVVGIAERHKDFHLVEFISQDFLREQNESICTLARLLARSKSMIDTSVGEYLFDRLLFESFVVNSKENLMYLRMLKRQNSEDGVYK